jgi:hypothetical protein
MVGEELTRSGINGIAHQCVYRGGLRAVPIFEISLRRMGKRALLSHDGNSLEGSGRFDAQEYNASCSYPIAAPHGPAFFT